MILLLKAILGILTGLFSLTYFRDVIRNRSGKPAKAIPARLGIGFATNFLDTLGIGSFAQQTALFKFFRLVDDRLIPGTMNVGDTIPTVIQAFIFMTVVDIDKITLISVAASASLGALLGAGVVARLSRPRIQTGMGIGLMLVGFLILSGLLNLLPLGGEATGLTDGVWLDERGDARFPQGAFYASHLDQGVAAFDWRDIATALELPACPR